MEEDTYVTLAKLTEERLDSRQWYIEIASWY